MSTQQAQAPAPHTRKQRKSKQLITGRDPVSQLYRAVDRYVKSKGGSLVVIGGIQVQQWPGDPAHSFVVAVKCMGRQQNSRRHQMPDNPALTAKPNLFTLPEVKRPEWLDDGLKSAQHTFQMILDKKIPDGLHGWMLEVACLRVLRAVHGDDLSRGIIYMSTAAQ